MDGVKYEWMTDEWRTVRWMDRRMDGRGRCARATTRSLPHCFRQNYRKSISKSFYKEMKSHPPPSTPHPFRLRRQILRAKLRAGASFFAQMFFFVFFTPLKHLQCRSIDVVTCLSSRDGGKKNKKKNKTFLRLYENR